MTNTHDDETVYAVTESTGDAGDRSRIPDIAVRLIQSLAEDGREYDWTTLSIKIEVSERSTLNLATKPAIVKVAILTPAGVEIGIDPHAEYPEYEGDPS